jgi:hypothetical protein
MCFSRRWITSDLAEKWTREQLKMFWGALLDLPKNWTHNKTTLSIVLWTKPLEGSKELFPKDFPLVGATTLVMNQAMQGSSLGDKDSKLG